MTASSENLYKAPLLQSQESPKDPKPNFDAPRLPLRSTEGHTREKQEKQEQELSKSQKHSKTTSFQHQFQHCLMDNVFQFRSQASTVLSKKPGTENSPAKVTTKNNQDFKRNFLAVF